MKTPNVVLNILSCFKLVIIVTLLYLSSSNKSVNWQNIVECGCLVSTEVREWEREREINEAGVSQ